MTRNPFISKLAHSKLARRSRTEYLYFLELAYAKRRLPIKDVDCRNGTSQDPHYTIRIRDVFHSAKWFHSKIKLTQKDLDSLVSKTISQLQTGMNQGAFEKMLIAMLLSNGLHYLGEGKIGDKLNGKSLVGITEGVETLIPDSIKVDRLDEECVGYNAPRYNATIEYNRTNAVGTSSFIPYFRKSRLGTIRSNLKRKLI